jgi:hypothetical protein
MKIVAFNKKAAPVEHATALESLRAHQQALADLAADDAEWAKKEEDATKEVERCGKAQGHLHELEQRLIDARADVKAVGRTATDMPALTREIEAAKVAAEALIEAGRLAASMLTRHIAPKRESIRLERIKLAGDVRPLVHAAAMEKLAASMAVLVEAETRYVDALQQAFGASAVVDDVAKQPGVPLPLSGYLDLAEFWLQRPVHPAYESTPTPLRTAIGAAIAAHANGVAAELVG